MLHLVQRTIVPLRFSHIYFPKSVKLQDIIILPLPSAVSLLQETKDMELDERGFIEELLAHRREAWETFPTGMSELLFSSEARLGCFKENLTPASPNYTSVEGLPQPNFDCLSEVCCPFVSGFTAPEKLSSTGTAQEDCRTCLEEDELNQMCRNEDNNSGQGPRNSNVELAQLVSVPPVFGMGSCMERKNSQPKKAEGTPSKNLMAERRRRKRLNDRLAMLRSVVPKVSKMDRTSILGDTIDYMKELLQRIKSLQEEIDVDPEQANILSVFEESKPSEILVRSSPKFHVERREGETRVEMFCASRPGLLPSTLSTLDSLGLEIEQCVVSCFNDFEMQASFSGDMEQRLSTSSEDIKRALFRNAGYGGRCM